MAIPRPSDPEAPAGLGVGGLLVAEHDRLHHLGPDNRVELVGSEYNPAAKVEKEDGEGENAPKKAKGVGDRIKRAAQRIRGKGEGGSKAQAGGQTRGKAQKSTTPRKAGGS